MALEAPFSEHDSVAGVRRVARRLADSPLAIYVTGEVGTGRRTLATELALHRAAGSHVTEIVGGQTLAGVRNQVLLLSNPDLLSPQEQVQVAGWIAAGARVAAWGPPSWPQHAHPELKPHLANALVELPPLRERGRDAIAWAHHFAERRAGGPVVFSRGADEVIAKHGWPGNLTQLDGAVTRALALRRDHRDSLQAADLGFAPVDESIKPLADAVEQFRREYILSVLARFDGNRTRTARALGVDARTVFRYLEKETSD